MEKKNPKLIKEIPSEKLGVFSADTVYIEIPRNIRLLKVADLATAIRWRETTRKQFSQAFKKKYIPQNIVFSPDDKRIFFELGREK